MALDETIRRQARAEARRRGVSVSSLVNEALAELLRRRQRAARAGDPACRAMPFRAAPGMAADIDAVVYDRP